MTVLLAMTGPAMSAAGMEPVTWSRQFGGPSREHVEGVAATGSGIYAVGWTGDALPGQVSLGDGDAFVRRYDAAGNEVWTRQFGTAEFDVASAVAAAGAGVYVAGETSGSLGGANAGGPDGFVRRYDAAGTAAWTRQFGDFSSNDVVAVAATRSAVYVVGQEWSVSRTGGKDVLVRKFDSAGRFVWKRAFGTGRDELPFAVSATADGVYVAGTTRGRFPGQTRAGEEDSFIRRYDPAGREVWTRQFGTLFGDGVVGVSAKPFGIFAVGYEEYPGSGETDGFVRKYDAAGRVRWIRRFGTPYIDFARRVQATETGIYVAGQSVRPNPRTLFDTNNVSVRKYFSGGRLSWVREFGNQTEGTTVGVGGVAATATDLFVGGSTHDALPGHTSGGEWDGFLVRMQP